MKCMKLLSMIILRSACDGGQIITDAFVRIIAYPFAPLNLAQNEAMIVNQHSRPGTLYKAHLVFHMQGSGPNHPMIVFRAIADTRF